MQLIGVWEGFFIGIIGALVGYLANFRTTRLEPLFENPTMNNILKFILSDLFLFIICGGLTVAFGVEPETKRAAFFSGAGWQGIIGSSIVGVDRNIRKTKRSRDEIIKTIPKAKNEYMKKGKE